MAHSLAVELLLQEITLENRSAKDQLSPSERQAHGHGSREGATGKLRHRPGECCSQPNTARPDPEASLLETPLRLWFTRSRRIALPQVTVCLCAEEMSQREIQHGIGAARVLQRPLSPLCVNSRSIQRSFPEIRISALFSSFE